MCAFVLQSDDMHTFQVWSKRSGMFCGECERWMTVKFTDLRISTMDRDAIMLQWKYENQQPLTGASACVQNPQI